MVLAVVLAASVGADGGMAAVMPGRAEAPPTMSLDGSLPIPDDEALAGFVEPDHLTAVPVGPGAVAEPVRAVLSSARVIEALDASGIPEVALRAYQDAAARQAVDDPSCGIRWTLIAAIGRVESNHGRFGGAELRSDGYGTRPIRGIPLDGRPNVALIRDSDGGELDGDTTFDRAVGPMQFIPSTWRSVGVDGNGDGRRDPNNIIDAAHAAADYLCAGDADLRDPAQRAGAVRRYNNADEYVRVVLRLAEMYETGRVEALPSLPATPAFPPFPSPSPAPPSPPGDAGPSSPAPSPAPTSPDPAPPAPPTPAPPSAAPAPTPAPTAPAPASPDPGSTAAVGWAPAMREVVVEIIEDETPAPPATTTTTAPPPPTTAPPTTAPPTTVPPEPAPECPPAAPDSPPASDTSVPPAEGAECRAAQPPAAADPSAPPGSPPGEAATEPAQEPT